MNREVVARASRPCVGRTNRTGETPVPLFRRNRFMVPMHGKKADGAFHEPSTTNLMHGIKGVRAFHQPHELRVRALVESGGGPPHSKTLSRGLDSLELPPGVGVRQSSGALAVEASEPKAPQDWRSPRRRSASCLAPAYAARTTVKNCSSRREEALNRWEFPNRIEPRYLGSYQRKSF